MLEKSGMKRKSTSGKLEWNASFWLVALWPLIVVAIVAIGFLAADVIKAL
jgi:nitrate reductase NapE component